MSLFIFQRPPTPPSQSAQGGSAPTDLPYVALPPNASTSSIPPANGPPPTDGSQPIPSPTSPASADGTRPTGLVQGNPAPSYGEPSSPPASSVPSFNSHTPPAPSGSGLTPPQGPPSHERPQTVPVDGSVPTDLPYIVQPASLTPSSSSLPPVNDPAPTGLVQTIPAANSPAPTDSAVRTGTPVPNVSSYPGTSVKGPASSGIPPVPAPDSPAASALPSVSPVNGTPKLSGISDVDVRII